jgi:Forkhead domain
VKTEKRKYTKRKPKDPDAAIKKEGSQDDEKAAKEKKEKKSSRPPRSPSPTFNEEDLTPEQLAKPQANYVTLIHDALSNSPTGQMSLPQIYRAIQRKYPFFVLKCNTNGWQSSVRHNLSQHHAFRKVERDGKGWMWAIVDGVPIEKEKKRRPTPPHQLPLGSMHQQIYRAGPALPQHMMPRPPGMMGPPPGYPMNGHVPPNLPPGHHPHYPGALMNGYPMQAPYPAVNGQHPQNFTGPSPSNPSIGSQPTGYSSPYAPKPTSNAPNPNPPNVAGDQNRTLKVPPPQSPHQQGHPPYLPGPQLPNESTARAIETFKTALIGSLKGKSNNAEAVVTSAINRVLGIASQSNVPEDPNEEKIMVAFRSMLDKLIPPTQPPHPSVQQQSASPQSQHPPLSGSESLTPIQTNPTSSNAAKSSTANPQSAPSIARPSFSSQSHNRPNGATTSVPRPPMMTPGIARSSPASSAPAPSRSGGATLTSAFPAPPAPSIISNNSDKSEDYNAGSDATVKAVQNPHVNNENHNPNGKRPLEDVEDVNGNEREFKRLSTTGPPPLKA